MTHLINSEYPYRDRLSILLARTKTGRIKAKIRELGFQPEKKPNAGTQSKGPKNPPKNTKQVKSE